jgi:hypothetical protein
MRSRFTTLLLFIVAVLAVGAVTASAALASPEWYVKKAGTWSKVTGPVPVTFKTPGSTHLEMLDTKFKGPFGSHDLFGISCKAEGEGYIEPGSRAYLANFHEEGEFSRCTPVTGPEEKIAFCDEVERVEGLRLPWKTELYTESSEDRLKLLTSKEQGWDVWCKAPGIGERESAFCQFGKSAGASNNASAGTVELAFTSKSGKTYCDPPKTESERESAGEWLGKLSVAPTETGVEAIKIE